MLISYEQSSATSLTADSASVAYEVRTAAALEEDAERREDDGKARGGVSDPLGRTRVQTRRT